MEVVVLGLEEIIQQAKVKPEPRSIIRDWFLSLNEEDQAVAERAFKDKSIGDTALHRAFTQYGANYSRYALQMYRQKFYS